MSICYILLNNVTNNLISIGKNRGKGELKAEIRIKNIKNGYG